MFSYTANPSTSLLIGSRTTNTLFKAFRAGILLGSNTNSIAALPNGVFYFGARFSISLALPDFYTLHQLAFAFIGSGLSDAEAATLYTNVQTFQTTLGRQV